MIKRSIDYIERDMSQMESILAKRDNKYRRNFNRYCNNGNRMDDIWTIYGNVLAYYGYNEDFQSIPYLNILRSAVDTTASKLSQTKVRPFFNPVLGNFKTIKTCRNAQVYFDEYYEYQHVYKKVVESLTDALIFDMGVLYINDEDKSVRRVAPWMFFFDLAEMSNNNLTKCELWDRNYPLIYLRNLLKPGSELYGKLETNPSYVASYKIYWDLLNKKKYKFVDNILISEQKIEYDKPPFVWMYYKDPIKGAFSDSMVDVLYRIQRMIDMLTSKIATAAELSPANVIFIPRGSDVKASQIASAKIGDIFEYNLSPTAGNPITVAIPPVIDSMYLQLLEMFEQKAFNMVGISQLSAQSKKPSGLNSGVALQTLEDVESERHNVLLNNVITITKDVAERMIDIFPETEEVLPKRRGRSTITWKDIKSEREMFNIQYSASNSLSKDPKVKMEQIEKLIAMKVIDPVMVSTLLEMPDLESAYSVATAAYDMNEKTIERVIEDGPNPETGKYHFYECTNIQQLYSQAINTLLRLDANDEKPEVLDNLVQFISQLKVMMDEINTALAPPPPPAPIAPPEVAGPTNELPLEAQ